MEKKPSTNDVPANEILKGLYHLYQNVKEIILILDLFSHISG